MIAHGRSPPRPTAPKRLKETYRVAIRPTPGRSLVTRRAVVDIVRTATLGSYGVTGFAGGPIERLIGRLGLGQPGLTVRMGEALEIELDLSSPSACRSQRSRGRSIRRSAMRSGARSTARSRVWSSTSTGFGSSPGWGCPSRDPAARPIRSRDLADSGTDVA